MWWSSSGGSDLRSVLWLYSDTVINDVIDSFLIQALLDLLHGIEMFDRAISDHANTLRSHVLEVHADFLCYTGAEPDRRSSHLESILLLAGQVHGSGIVTLQIPLGMAEKAV